MRIGRYKILFNPHKLYWFQTYKPTVVRQWWRVLILEEVDVTRIDKGQRFKLGIVAESITKKYVYCKSGEL